MRESTGKWAWREECAERFCPGVCDLCIYSGPMWTIDLRELSDSIEKEKKENECD